MHTEQLLSPSVASVDTVSVLRAALQSGELVHRCVLMLVKVAVKRKSAPLKLLSNLPLARLTLWPHPVLCCCSQRLRKLSWPGLFLTKQQLQPPSLERGEYWFPVRTSCGWLTFYTHTSICIALHLLWKKHSFTHWEWKKWILNRFCRFCHSKNGPMFLSWSS